MVDINLFDDDEEEVGGNQEEQQPTEDTSWDAFDSGKPEENASSGEGEAIDTDSLDDAFGFDDDFSDDDTLDDESILDESDAVPDFEDGEAPEDEDDYQFGDMKKKGASKGLLVVLAIVLLGVLGYVSWMQGWLPVSSSKKPTTSTKRTTVSKPTTVKPGQTPKAVAADSGSVALNDSAGASIAKPVIRGAVPVNSRIANTTKAIVTELSKTGRLGVLIIEKDRFRVEYISDEAGSARSAGERLKTLFNLDEVKQSPEEQVSSSGSVVYSSVLSGILTQIASGSRVTGTPFANAKAAQDAVASIAAKNQLVPVSLKMKSAQDRDQISGAVFEGIYEGSQGGALSMIEALSTISSPILIDKALLYPQQNKLVLDLWAATQ